MEVLEWQNLGFGFLIFILDVFNNLEIRQSNSHFLCLVAHVGNGQYGPPLHCATLRHLSWVLFGAGHSVHATGVLTGTYKAAERQSQPTEAAQLVCADRKGELSACLHFSIQYVCT